MSDFLSKFTKDNYQEKQEHLEDIESDLPEEEPAPLSYEKVEQEEIKRERPPIYTTRTTRATDELTEVDTTFKKKRIKKYSIIALICLLSAGLLFFAYYQFTRVKLPDFKKQEISEARTWLSDNGLYLELVKKYSDTSDINTVLSQKQKAGKKVKKNSTIQLTISQGPDPEVILPLPDFMTMTKAQAEEWKEENKAENLSILEEYSDTVEKGKTLKLEFNNNQITSKNYQRKEKAKVYFSKGKEVFEKNITVPDFSNQMISEVEKWAATNEIKVTYDKKTSNTIDEDKIISQSITKNEKVAKKDAMTVVVSVGKGIVVPNFAEYSMEEAATATTGLNIQVKQVFNETVPYGQLVSQSLAAGTELTGKDESTVHVQYSVGRPYIKDLRGTMVEGELPKYFYEEYQMKGANITFQCRYVDSAELKGTVTGVNVMNQYLPMEYTLIIDISRGNLVAQGDAEGNG